MVNISDIKLPPHNIDAEKSILCAVLIDNETMYVADTFKLSSTDFYQKEHQIIRDGMMSLWAKKTNIDIITLTDAIGKA
jgi:replicative DNA helicase